MGSVSGSTNRPERPERDPAPSPGAEPRDARAQPGAARSGPEWVDLSNPIDLRSRATAAHSSSSMHSATRSGARVPSASTTGPHAIGPRWAELIDSLAGDVVLSHIAGRRVLDLGYGSPEISEWVSERIGDHLSIVEKGALEQAPGPIADHSGFLPASEFLDEEGELREPEQDEEGEGPPMRLDEYHDGQFDVVYCLRTFPHLGFDTDSSEKLGRQLLREAARVTADGGTVFVQIANPRSLRGIVEGIRNPITVVSRRRMILGDRYGLTRWDTLSRFLRSLPPELEFVRVHGLGVLIPHNATLEIPLIGPLLGRLEWIWRDLGIVRRFGAQLLVVLRRLHRSDPSLREGGPTRSALSSSLLSSLGSGSRERPADDEG